MINGIIPPKIMVVKIITDNTVLYKALEFLSPCTVSIKANANTPLTQPVK